MPAHDLDRFIAAQEPIYDRALAEVRAGAKRSHWMWYIFPQIAGLGQSAMAQRYALANLAEAEAYLAHPVLGERLRAITMALADLPIPDAVAVFGGVDAMKLHSSLTLFAKADSEADGLFCRTLGRWFDSTEDSATVERL